jgi:hypothetical protein
MSDGHVSTPSCAGAHPEEHIAAQCSIREALLAHAAEDPRSLLARFLGVSPVGGESRRAFAEALGKASVGDALDGLGPQWTVLHALPVGEHGATLDHLVLGPAGVFVIRSSVHPGVAVWVEQRAFVAGDIRHPYIREMEYEMGRVERILSEAAGRAVEVSGVVAVVDARSVIVRQAHRDVAVVRSTSLTHWLQSRPNALCEAQVARIAAAARDPESWHAPTTEADDPGALRSAFAALRRDVERARTVQRLWATAITTAGVGGVALAVYSVLTGVALPFAR